MAADDEGIWGERGVGGEESAGRFGHGGGRALGEGMR